MIIKLPLRTVSGNVAHAGEHWAVRARRAKEHRTVTFAAISNAGPLPPRGPSGMRKITLTRIAPRELDQDNLRMSMKSVLDGVSDACGISDRFIDAKYLQRKGKVKEYAVEIEFTQ